LKRQGAKKSRSAVDVSSSSIVPDLDTSATLYAEQVQTGRQWESPLPNSTTGGEVCKPAVRSRDVAFVIAGLEINDQKAIPYGINRSTFVLAGGRPEGHC
jgi:hypothetical protein